MADLQTYLRNLILLPKTGIEEKVTDLNYPERAINFLNLVRDHYTKYQTTFALFYPSPSNNALLTLGGSVESLEKAASLFQSSTSNIVVSGVTTSTLAPIIPLQLNSDLPIALRNFLLATTLGFKTNQTMISGVGSRYISTESDRQAVVNRITDKSTTGTMLVAGVSTIVPIPPAWWTEINLTNVLNTSTVPTGSEVISIINSVLAEAYSYYAMVPSPITYNNEIINAAPSPYWTSYMAKRISMAGIDPKYLLGKMCETAYVTFAFRDLNKNYIENGTGIKKILANYNYPIPSDFYGVSPVPANYLASLPTDKLFWDSMMGLFGDLYDLVDCEVSSVLAPITIGNMTIDPFQTSSTNMGSGLYNSSFNVNYYLENNTLIVLNASTGVAVPAFNIWLNLWPGAKWVYLMQTHTEKILINKQTGLGFPSVSSAGNPSNKCWLLNLLNAANVNAKNPWLTKNTTVSPYVKFFTSGLVTLQYLQSIQVRDTILKTEKGNDLYLFPSFMIYDESLLTADPYSNLNFRINSTLIKSQLASAIEYITGQLFAQDIATLNTMSARFDMSINVNEQAKARLDSELVKMNEMDAQLTAKLMEAKKLFTMLDILKANLGNTPDPVLAYQQQIQSKLDLALSDFTASETTRISNEIASAKAIALQAQLDAENSANAVKLANDKLIAEAAIAEAKRLADIEALALAKSIEDQKLAVVETVVLPNVPSITNTSDLITSPTSDVPLTSNIVTTSNVAITPVKAKRPPKINYRMLLRVNRLAAKKALLVNKAVVLN